MEEEEEGITLYAQTTGLCDLSPSGVDINGDQLPIPDCVDAKNGNTSPDWTTENRDKDQVLKSVLKHNAAFCCARQCHN